MSVSRKRRNNIQFTRSLLASRGLTLAEIARQSRNRFPQDPSFHIPANFYDALRHRSFTPSGHQFFALSVLTGYSFAEWLAAFDLRFDDAVRFQVSRPRYYTTELDTRIYAPANRVAWFEESGSPTRDEELQPLSRWLHDRTVRRLDSLPGATDTSRRYFKIGSRDVYAFPDLLPGSVVRMALDASTERIRSEDRPSRILVIAHAGSVFCSRVRVLERNRIVLCSRQLPYAPTEFVLGRETRVLGHVDLEIRRLQAEEAPEVRSSWRVARPSHTPDTHGGRLRLGEFLLQARLGAGFSLREASQRMSDVARTLRHPSYACAPGTLSDLEAADFLPRHIHKWISLSAVYSVPIAELAARAGLALEKADTGLSSNSLANASRSPFLRDAQQQVGEIPFFLYRALSDITGLPNLSVRDLFWTGASSEIAHPYLRNSLLLAINRKSKSPAPSLAAPVWAQPLYVLELRGGKRICAACTREGSTLVVRPCTTVSGEILRFQRPAEVEILGRVVALVRRVS